MLLCELPLLLPLLLSLVIVAGSMEYFSLYCHSGYRLVTTAQDKTFQGLSKLRCLQACHRQARTTDWIVAQCKSISYNPTGGHCVFSPLRLFNPQDVDTAEGWTVCTQRVVLFGYAKAGVAYRIPANQAADECAGLGDSRIATFQQLKYAWNHGWTYCAWGRVSNGSLLILGNEFCNHIGFNQRFSPDSMSNVFCIGSRAKIAIHENQRAFAFGFGYVPY